LAGFPIIIGGLISSVFQARKSTLKAEINHWIVAFGGGALLSAIAFALIPKAIVDLSYVELTVIFLSGTFVFMFIDILIARIGGSLAQAISMMMDFIPEALALGASFAHNHNFGLLLAMFIGMQNLPEGFNAYRELHAGGSLPGDLGRPAAGRRGGLRLRLRAGVRPGDASERS